MVFCQTSLKAQTYNENDVILTFSHVSITYNCSFSAGVQIIWKKLDSKKTIIAIGNMVINQVMMMMVIIIHADIGDDDDDDFENNRC